MGQRPSAEAVFPYPPPAQFKLTADSLHSLYCYFLIAQSINLITKILSCKVSNLRINYLIVIASCATITGRKRISKKTTVQQEITKVTLDGAKRRDYVNVVNHGRQWCCCCGG